MLKLQLSAVFFTVCFLLGFGKADWWEYGNFYQIYPRSFQDSDGDGIGDLKGATQHLEYLKDIGMDGVWLSPIFKSPMVDFGYDISDYYEIQPDYGTLEDLINMILKAHSLGLKLILDFVPNHTSDQHEWFIRSVNGDPEYNDYYIWANGIVNDTTGEIQPPSNWLSEFRHSAWEWNDQRQQYYLHQFTKEQPDLNFRNPKVLKALKDVMYYWFDLGIDGFRIDAVTNYFEAEIDPSTGMYPNEPVIADVASCPDPNDWCHLDHKYTYAQPEDITIIYDWRAFTDEYALQHNTPTKILLTEAYAPSNFLMKMYSNGVRNGSQISFNFEFMRGINNQSSAAQYEYYINHWLDNLPKGAFANWVLGNHDNPRIASRFGVQRTDLINILLQTLPGIAVTYNGEEIGMEDVYVSWKDSVDPQGCNTNPQDYLKYSRDIERTPFRWNSSKNAGFSTANKTWLPVGAGYESNNVEVQLAAPNSHLKIFKALTKLRKAAPAFSIGNFKSKVVDDVLLYKRQAENGDAYVVVLNIGGADTALDLFWLFEGVGIMVEVVISSLQSGLENGQFVFSSGFIAKAYNGYVLRVVEDSFILRST